MYGTVKYVRFVTNDPHDNLYKIFLWKQCIVGSTPQDEHFSEEKRFILHHNEKENSFRRDSNPRSMGYGTNPLPLSYLTCWWMGIKVGHIKRQIVCLQINTNPSTLRTQLLQIDKLWTISNKMLCKNSSNSNISHHRCLFDKNVTRMLQQEGILGVLKIFFVRKWIFLNFWFF